MNTRISGLQIANIAAYIVTLMVNFLSQSASALGVSLFPTTIAALGESRAIFFLPAGYVFAIWGVIYLGLGAYVIYQGRPSQRQNPIIGKIGWWFVLSSIGNVTWLILFLNNQVALSTVAMLVILVSLLAIYLRLGIGRAAVSRGERWAVHVPFSIYLGWITVATVANISAMLYDAGNVTAFLGISADVWAVIMMSIAAVIALAMVFTRGDAAFALVVVWALLGIYARPFNTPVFEALSALNAGLVDGAALLLAVAIAAGIGVRWFLSRRRPAQLTAQPA
jgi:hypothetical protein